MKKEGLLLSLKNRGFSKKILDAFSKVKREDFVPLKFKSIAYEDTPLPIGDNQTISQPYTIAMMLSLLNLKKSQKVLEIGSGSGYVLALISEIVGKNGRVFGIEIVKPLFLKLKENISSYKNIRVYNKNGALGLPENAPFDRILISAASKNIPKSLPNQLKNNGIIVAPIGEAYAGQSLTVFQKKKNKMIIKKEIPGFTFVPFVED